MAYFMLKNKTLQRNLLSIEFPIYLFFENIKRTNNFSNIKLKNTKNNLK